MLAYLGKCRQISSKLCPKEVSCFTGTAPRASKQGACPHLGPAGAGQRASIRTCGPAGKRSLCTFTRDVPHSRGHCVQCCPSQLAGAFLPCCLLSRECGKYPAPGWARCGQTFPVAFAPSLQMSSAAVPTQLTRPGHSAQYSGIGGYEPCPATSPVAVGSFPASSHMTLSLFTSLSGLPACGVPMPPRV